MFRRFILLTLAAALLTLTPARVTANDPPACLGTPSPGITNSWAKWSPQVLSLCGNTYYFFVFSSTRDPMAAGPQLYVAPMVVDAIHDPLVQPPPHESCIPKVSRDKFFLRVNCTRQRRQHDKPALASFEVHAVKSPADKKVACGRSLELVDFIT